MSIESLKAQARRHEQKEEWQKALDQYAKAIRTLDADDQPDSGLHNRVGDLFIKVGNYEKALEHYERAIELYRDAFLPNNAIAVCKKIVRHLPGRNQVFLLMGQIRAEQGFIPDARENFLKYAELSQEAGDMDESFRALIEFADLVKEDVDVRITVADQMLANERMEEGVHQLSVAYQILKQTGRDDRAFGLESRLLELDPTIDFDALADETVALGAAPDDGFEYMTPYGEEDDEEEGAVAAPTAEGLTDADSLALEEDPGAPDQGDTMGELDLVEADEGEDAGSWDEPAAEEDASPPVSESLEDAWVEASVEEPEEEGVPAELPLMEDPGELDDDEAAAPELPLMDVGEDDEYGEEDEPAELPGFDEDVPARSGFEEEASEELSGFDTPDGVEATPSVASPETPEPAPESAAPPSDEYVDLGSMILGDDAEAPKTTRFRVQYEEPTGDEAADFQKMLSQFKEKVSENLDASDVRAHHDLGTAYKEMGLLDEAISEFQSALRASSDHLPTYELMGQTFLEMGKNEAAVKSLERALNVRPGVEDELLGIYYYLARAYEQLGQNDAAVEFYDRVFALDINFADVTERLRALR